MPILFSWFTILFLVSINWFKTSGVGQYCSFTWDIYSGVRALFLAWINWSKRYSPIKDWSLVIINLSTWLPKLKIRCPNLFFPLGLTCSGVLSSITDSGICCDWVVSWACCLATASSCLVSSSFLGVTFTSSNWIASW